MASKIKLFISDVDGVMTDGGMYYCENGTELKRFHTHDGMGIELLREKNVKTAIITKEKTDLVTRRSEKLKIDHLYQGVDDKLAIAKEICQKENISLHETAYIGDDVNDIELLKNVGLAACPQNAVHQVKKIQRIMILTKGGGEGAVREFIDYILTTFYGR
jgi:3-deoxy-D-manno-octulosonate 8-phosphate phosphatase (KDO 8-P phosphatase)